MISYFRRSILVFIFSFFIYSVFAQIPEFSTAGFYEAGNTDRKVQNFNIGWRFQKGAISVASISDIEDKAWEVVNLPHGLEDLPYEASGGINYQGEAWYQKHFSLEKDLFGDKKVWIHFEAIMGKSKIYLNGHLVKEHYGGYLPVIIDATDDLKWDNENIITVWADNSDDSSYPPGKPQSALDFAYFGGIYRDCWLVATNKVYITNPNFETNIAGGGTFIHIDSIQKSSARLFVKTQVSNESGGSTKLKILYEVLDAAGKVVSFQKGSIGLGNNQQTSLKRYLAIKKPRLWTPETPNLYRLRTSVFSNNVLVDATIQRFGVRTIEFRGKDGFFLNGKPYGKLSGVNRHQDFALIGNAMPNSLHWKDAKKLKDAGFNIVRSAHYPQDPAFMDACDELGLFVIVATPGWQWWNKAPSFAAYVIDDIRQMVRRDRNHPSVIMWEPILNETRYPDEFAKKVHKTVKAEYPYMGCYTACDHHAIGSSYFDVLYGSGGKLLAETNKSVFRREWGDNVCDFAAHNSPSRVSRNWGEHALLYQSEHYSKSRDYQYYDLESIYTKNRQFTGGTLWHAFDHQRGYHPDPFYGGIMDAFRQPKPAYYMFTSQRDPHIIHETADSGPFIKISHDMNPFSPTEVTVFSNCDSVSLTGPGVPKQTIKREDMDFNQPHPPMRFEQMYHFMHVKQIHRERVEGLQKQDAQLIAIGYLNGEVAETDTVWMVEEIDRIQLRLDNENIPLIANGSDIATVVASYVDEAGHVKRLNNKFVKFEIEGEGEIVSNDVYGVNPQKLEWGTAVILIRSTHKPGSITLTAKSLFPGDVQPAETKLVFKSLPDENTSFNYSEVPSMNQVKVDNADHESVDESDKKVIKKRLLEIQREQEDFEKNQQEE